MRKIATIATGAVLAFTPTAALASHAKQPPCGKNKAKHTNCGKHEATGHNK